MFRKISPNEQKLMILLRKGRLCWCDPLTPPPSHTPGSKNYFRYVGLHPERLDIDESTLQGWAKDSELYEYMKEKLSTPDEESWG